MEFERQMIKAYYNIYRAEFPHNPDFIRLMKNRLLQGGFRYTTIRNQQEKREDYDHFGEILRRFVHYRNTGNPEYLVDAANFCLATLIVGWYPERSIDAKSHTGVIIQVGGVHTILMAIKLLNWMGRTTPPVSTIDFYNIAAMAMFAYSHIANVDDFKSTDDGIHMERV
jgi:hypothetical protein